MAMETAGLNIAAEGLRTAITHLSLHSSAPNGSGSNETTAARVASGFGAASGGVITATNKSFTGGAASGAVTHVGFWSASTAGTFYGSYALTGDASFNAAGEYTVTSVAVTAANL